MMRSALCLAALALAAPPWFRAATISTTVFSDDSATNGNCTLREAIQAANTDAAVDACPAGEASPVVDRVVLQAGSYTLGLGASLLIQTDLELEGAGQTLTDVNGTPTLGIFSISGAQDPIVSIHDLTLHHGHRTRGGCIEQTSGELTVTDSTLHDCSAEDEGGAIYHRAQTLELVRVTLRDNTAGLSGGALHNFFGASTLIDSVVVGNRTDPATGSNHGGGLSLNTGSLTLVRTVVSGNESSLGGGISASGGALSLTDVTLDRNRATSGGGGLRTTGNDATLVRTTISHNLAHRGGGARLNAGALALTNSTISGNRADEGGGIYGTAGEQLELVAATVAHNSAPTAGAIQASGAPSFANSLILGACILGGGSPTSLGGNLESPGDTCGLTDPSDQTAVAHPALTAVADHGGLTHTDLPLPGSPAIDAALIGNCPADDQRGTTRPLDGDGVDGAACDTGAVEAALGEDAPLFTDGFEAGDTLSWTATEPPV